MSGTHTITLTVADPLGNTGTDDVIVKVTRKPVADASATDLSVISKNGVDALVTLDGSNSSDPDGDPLTFTWYQAGQKSFFKSTPDVLLGTGEVLQVTRPVGSSNLKLVVNDGITTASVSFTVKVLTPAQATAAIKSKVNQRYNGLTSSTKSRLSSILTAAETAFKNGDTVGGAAQLLLFQDALDTFLGTGAITQTQHDAWDADAAEIINAVT
jgi:hypothetical protein